MKNIRSFLLVDLIIMLLKILGGYVCRSNALIFSSIYEFIIMICLLCSLYKKDNKSLFSIITLLFSLIFIGISSYRLFISSRVLISKIKSGLFVDNFNIPSLWIILFLLVLLIIRYFVQSLKTGIALNNKNGLLGIGNIKSNYDFSILGIILLSVILNHLGKIKVLKFLLVSSIIGEILIMLFILIKGIKIFINSIKSFSNNFEVDDKYRNEISNRKEVRKLNSIKIYNFGGIRTSKVSIEANSGISMLDMNSFILTLQDFMLKTSDVVEVWLGSSDNIYSNVMQRRMNNAGNSRGRNSSSNTKKKNNRKKNKKR